MVLPASLFFSKILLTIQGPLRVHVNFRMSFSLSAKGIVGILIGIELNLQVALIGIDILIVISVPLHEHGMYFHSFMSCLISFSSILQFSLYKSSPPWLS